MNNSKNIMIAVVALILIAGGVFALKSSGEDGANESSETAASDVMEKDGDTMEKDGEAMEKDGEAMEKDGDDSMEKHDDAVMDKEDDSMEKMDKDGEAMEESSMEKHGSFISVADYESDASAYDSTEKVYFFHASWCPICKAVEKELEEDLGQIPSGVAIIKADYDSETALRQKYGVTTQYTFVQIDNDGNQVKKWSATSADKAISGILL